MNFLYRRVSSALSSVLSGPRLALPLQSITNTPSPLTQASPLLSWCRGFEWKPDPRRLLEAMLKKGPHIKKRKNKNPLGYNVPFAKGVVLKTLIKKPKKPNSANRKCVLVRLSSGKEMTAYVPGIGHNLQEHNVVLVRVGRLKDVPGVKIKCVRGKFDLPHVVKQPQTQK